MAQYKLVTCTINGKKREQIVDVRASLTDMLDGKIARKYNLVTNFGNLIADRIMNRTEVLTISTRLLRWIPTERCMWLSETILPRREQMHPSLPVSMLLKAVQTVVRRCGLQRLVQNRVCVLSVLRLSRINM